jgi:acetyl-CoA carboxylase alpha subunit
LARLPALVGDRQECEECEADERQKDLRSHDNGEIMPEPLGGAHRGRVTTIGSVGDTIERHLRELMRMTGAELRHRRRDKFLKMGQPAEG